MKQLKHRTILGAVSYIGAAFAFSVGTLAYFSATIISGQQGYSDVAAPALTILGIFMLVSAALLLLGGTGLWRSHDWARIPLVIMALFGVIMSLTSLATGNGLSFVAGIIINGIVLWHAFKKR